MAREWIDPSGGQILEDGSETYIHPSGGQIQEAQSAVNIEQEGYRFRNDDGSESAATWRQLQDVDDTIEPDTNIRLRVLVNT